MDTATTEKFFDALMAAGMPEIPQQFSVAPYPHLIPHTTLSQIETFIRIFDRITTSTTWRQTVTASAPEIARHPRSEVCFFSAWDFHLSPEQGWQLIECNDNGSGLLFASLINRLFYDVFGMARESAPFPGRSQILCRMARKDRVGGGMGDVAQNFPLCSHPSARARPQACFDVFPLWLDPNQGFVQR